jgi:hypothetical protein
MSTPARTVAVFGVYMLVVGLSFIFIPNIVLPLFGFGITTEIWIRVLGLLVMIVGIYYLSCARNEIQSFFQVSVFGRVAFCIGLVTLAFLNVGASTLIVFGLIDLAGAVWTWRSLRAAHRDR